MFIIVNELCYGGLYSYNSAILFNSIGYEPQNHETVTLLSNRIITYMSEYELTLILLGDIIN